MTAGDKERRWIDLRMNVADAKIAPASPGQALQGSPGASSVDTFQTRSSAALDSDDDEARDLNFDPHGELREDDPAYPDMTEENEDAYETDMPSDLEEDDPDAKDDSAAAKRKKRKEKKRTDAELKAGKASSNFVKGRQAMQKEIVSLILNELVPPEEEVDIDPPPPVKRKGWITKMCISCGKFFGCVTYDLHEAVMAGSDKHMDQALELVHQGKKSRRELCNQHNKDGHTPLSLAIKTKQPNIAFAILSRKVDPNVADLDTGRTPLFYACMQGKIGINQMLIQAGADPNYGDFQAVTPLMMAAQARDWRTVKYITSLRRKIEVDAQDFNGWSAMHYAASKDGYKAINWLIEAGASRNLPDNNKRQAVHIARLGDFQDSLAALEDKASRLAAIEGRY